MYAEDPKEEGELVKVISTLSDLKKQLKSLSEELPCGAKASIEIGNIALLTVLPKIAMALDLSFTDAKETRKGFLVVIENRFGKNCRDNG